MKDNDLFSIAQELEQKEIYAFETNTFQDLFQLDPRRAAYQLHRLAERNLIARIERGKYLFLGLQPERILSNPLFIGCQLATPSYISFWSALHYYGFTDQVPQTVFLATTAKRQHTTFHRQHYHFTTIPPSTFFGYRREIIAGLPVVMAVTTKTLIDCLLYMKPAGGLVHTANSLRVALREDRINKNDLSEYTKRINNKSLNSRLGFLIQLFTQENVNIEPSKGPVLLDPGRERRGRLDDTWNIYINVPEQLLSEEGIA